MSTKFKIALGVIIVAVMAVAILGGNAMSWNEAGMTQVLQYPSGELRVISEPGPYGQWWAKEYPYNQMVTVGFGTEQGGKNSDIKAIPVIFNDGSKAQISGLIRISIPVGEEQMVRIKKEYVRGFKHFVENGIVQVAKNSVRLAANLRSAQDAYTTLAAFQNDIEDQLVYGIYETEAVEEWIVKATGDSERVKFTKIAVDDNGQPKRRKHILQELGCQITQCQIEVPAFDKEVEGMITRKKKEVLETEVRQQEAIRAEQEAITAEATGKAEAMKIKWSMEKEKQAAVTTAEKLRDVARLEQEAAGYTKQKDILLGQGEAAKKTLVMQADGALELKLKAYVETQKLWSNAFANYGGNIVPVTSMGNGNGTSGGNGMENFMQLVTAKAAKDLSLDLKTK